MHEQIGAQSLKNSYGGQMINHKTPFGMHTDPRSTYFSESQNSFKQSRHFKMAPELKS